MIHPPSLSVARPIPLPHFPHFPHLGKP
jgi:hypothetical protein